MTRTQLPRSCSFAIGKILLYRSPYCLMAFPANKPTLIGWLNSLSCRPTFWTTVRAVPAAAPMMNTMKAVRLQGPETSSSRGSPVNVLEVRRRSIKPRGLSYVKKYERPIAGHSWKVLLIELPLPRREWFLSVTKLRGRNRGDTR